MEKGISVGRQRLVRIPPTAPTYVAPTFFTKSVLRASSTASTAMSMRSIGAGTNILVTNIMEPNSAMTNNCRFLCTVLVSFSY